MEVVSILKKEMLQKMDSDMFPKTQTSARLQFYLCGWLISCSGLPQWLKYCQTWNDNNYWRRKLIQLNSEILHEFEGNKKNLKIDIP